ncbi:GNAT family N-acetyltransferase [Methanococcoides methylutens]|uniref:Histone acetyltransferase HPA2 and related acetyltransferase n=1 Tax=Methanococcoides methylutens MM1 TaxID=1434104 RepID=A0A0E3X0A2_METMT|nr:GNAT family N-acetyltransferase [Methanococcoides methylutens]AKB85079.1 Histone acetyltransferase HPA2 and related acetyltransferase [Methanococcoides methylutens MM1]
MNQKSWKIRKAVVDDAKGLKLCMDLAYSKYLERLKGERLPPMDVDYEEEITYFPVWVAESGKEIVGGLILMFEDDYTTIANVAVRPDFQGTGLGRGLMDFAESEAKRRGYLEMRLATHVLLKENISFYLHLGWSEIEHDDTRVYMGKRINAS